MSSKTKVELRPQEDGTSSGGALRPRAAAACVPSDTAPASSAPAAAPAAAPRGPTHQHAMPSVNMPQVALAAIADSAVATPVQSMVLHFVHFPHFILDFIL